MAAHRLLLMLPFLLLATPWSAQAKDGPRFQTTVTALVDGVVLPAYADAAATGEALSRAVAADCGDDRAREAFRQAAWAFHHVQPITFGPAFRMAAVPQLEFFPDDKDRVARGVRQILAALDPTATDGRTLSRKSIAVTGFPALELLLFAEPATSRGDGFACRYAVALARNIARIEAEVLRAWQAPGGWADLMRGAAQGNAEYYSSEEAAAHLLMTASVAAASIATAKLLPGLGRNKSVARPARVEHRWSGLGMQAIRANLELIDALYRHEHGFGDLLRGQADEDQLDAAIETTLDDALDIASQVSLPLGEAVVDATDRQRLLRLAERAARLHLLLERELVGALGMTRSFNAADGD